MKMLKQEYFGGEAEDTKNRSVNRLMNRWQYKLLRLLETNAPHGIKISSLSEGLLAKNYKPQVEEDEGSININKSKPLQKDIDDFLEDMKKRKFIDIENKPIFDSKFEISNTITFPKLSSPRGAFIEMTNRCNLDCIMCYNKLARARGDNVLSSEEIIKFLDQLSVVGASSIGLTGGEPTLAENWPDVIKHAHELGMSIKLYTGGVYPEKKREDMISRLISLNIEETRITYTGMKDTNDRVRKVGVGSDSERGTFEEITRTVVELIKNKQSVKLNYVFSHDNIDDFEPFVRFVHDMSQKHSRPIPINITPLRSYENDGSSNFSVRARKIFTESIF